MRCVRRVYRGAAHALPELVLLFATTGRSAGGFRYFVELAVWQVGGGAAPLTGPKMRREAWVSKAVSANAGLCDADVAGLPCCARRVFAALVTATVGIAKKTRKWGLLAVKIAKLDRKNSGVDQNEWSLGDNS